MDFLEVTFRLGIIIAIFSFIWGVIRLILGLFRGGSVQSVVEEYFLKATKYIFLANIVVLTDIMEGTNEIKMNELILTGVILMMYFVSKFQKSQEKHLMFRNMPQGLPMFKTLYNPIGEITAISLGIASFLFFTFFPEYAYYGLSQWFYNGVISIEETFIIGFVFKLIGFFFLIGIIQKIINSFFVLVSGKPLFNVRSSFNYSGNSSEEDEEKKDDFDDFEEIK